jgi:hypothetical protein
LNQAFSISLPLEKRDRSYVLDFINSFPFTGYDTARFQSVIVQDEHIATFQIAVDHTLLFISQKQQFQELFFIRNYFFYLHILKL